MMTEKWQFVVNDSILNEKFGPSFLGARKNSRGPLLNGDALPEYVRQFFSLKKQQNGRWYIEGFQGKSVRTVKVEAHGVRWQTSRIYAGKGVAEIDAPKNPPLKPMSPEESAALAPVLEQIQQSIREQRGNGRDPYFKVLSFGGKDADLNPGGSTGIKELCFITRNRLLVSVGGSKTFCYSDPTGIEDEVEYQSARKSLQEAENDFLCHALVGYDVNGDEDGVYASFCDNLKISAVKKNGQIDIKTTARKIIRVAEARCDRFEYEMSEIGKDLEKTNTFEETAIGE
jgi:hypothetical protein